MSSITLKEFKAKALQNNEVKKEYDLLKPEYDIKRKLIAMRKKAETQTKSHHFFEGRKEIYWLHYS